MDNNEEIDSTTRIKDVSDRLEAIIALMREIKSRGGEMDDR